jgi:hypothetical protein
MKNNNIYKAFNLFCLLLLLPICMNLISCSKPQEDIFRQVKGEGLVIEMPIQVDTFNQINHVCQGDMEVIVTDTLQVVFEAQQNILDLMDWKVADSTFYWGFKEPVAIVEAEKIICKIKIPVNLASFILSGVGEVGISGPKQNSIYLEIAGVGNIRTYGLEVDKAEANISGYGNIEVRAISELNGIISGTGNIYYKGDPALNVQVFGSGDFIDDN